LFYGENIRRKYDKSSTEEPTGEVRTEKEVRYNRMILYGLFFVKYLLDRGNIGCPYLMMS
jgi:hypothetical protein